MSDSVDFADWLQREMDERAWNVQDMARAGDFHPSHLYRVLNRERNPGLDLCTGIAHALNYPPDLVFTKAGLLPSKPQDDITREATHLFDQLSDADQETVLIMMRALVRDKVRHATSKAHPQSSQS